MPGSGADEGQGAYVRRLVFALTRCTVASRCGNRRARERATRAATIQGAAGSAEQVGDKRGCLHTGGAGCKIIVPLGPPPDPAARVGRGECRTGRTGRTAEPFSRLEKSEKTPYMPTFCLKRCANGDILYNASEVSGGLITQSVE